MKKMTNDEARSFNGGWTIYQCNYCGWQIMVTTCWLLHITGIVQYWFKPSYCPHCNHKASWRFIKREI